MNPSKPDTADPTPSTEDSLDVRSPEPAAQEAGPRRLSLQVRILTIAAVLLAAGVLFWPRGDGTAEAPGGFLIDPGGRPVPVASRMAPVTLVHFWATWCPPCMTEVPSLTGFAEDFSQYLGDFTILMVAVDDDPERVEEFVGNRIGSVLYDPSWEVTHRYGTRKLPESYLVVRGNVVERWVGPQDWNDPEIRERVREAIEGLRSGEQASSPTGSGEGGPEEESAA